MARKQVTQSDEHNWLDVKIDGRGVTSLAYATTVDTMGVESGRENFTVLEGIYRGKRGSVKLMANGGSQFGSVAHRGPASVTFNISTGKVTYGGNSNNALVAKTQALNSVPIGRWSLQIPDEKHPGGFTYYGRSKHASCWFRIGDGRDRYLHPGRESGGCVTVTEIEKWTALSEYLTISRKGDGMNVGTITVTA